MTKIKVLIFDDHDSVRESYKRWLELEGFEIVGEERSAEKCVPFLKKLKPDIILMDIDFPEKERGGLAASRKITKEVNNAKVIIVSHYNEPSIIIEAFNSGALS